MRNILVLITIAGVMALTFVVGYFIGCPFRVITGIPCPGCGMTRAFASLFHLDFATAFAYHPLFPLIIIAVLIFVLCIFWYARKNNMSVLSLEGKDINAMMKNLFSYKLTIVFICIYVIAFLSVFIARFPNIP